MGEIRSPYFSCGGDYLGDNAEIQSPYFSFGARHYHGDNAEIHSSFFSVADYYREDAEIPSETFFHQDYNVENPYNEEQDVQNIFNTGKLNQHSNIAGETRIDIPRTVRQKIAHKPNDAKCIYRVPAAFSKSKGAVYTPRQISIGPIHHGSGNLQLMEKEKAIYFQEFCKRVVEKTKERQEEFEVKLLNTIEKNEKRIQQCYEDCSHKLEGKKFLEMVLFDAVFILEYLLRNIDQRKYKDDNILRKMRFWIRWDLMLLENQLPFFILEELYNPLPRNVKGDCTYFRDLAYTYFNRYIKSQYEPSNQRQILHFTDLVRSLLSFNHPDLTVLEPVDKVHSATKLREAAIKIKVSQNDECLLDIKFTSGELIIPRLEIDYYTECIFGNVMALEQRHYQGSEYICHYVKLLDTLIATPKDADLLIKKKIIDTKKGGDAVEILIKKLSAETSEDYSTEDYSCYDDLYKQLHQHYEKYWTENSILYLRETYFGNVWKGTATVSAILLLLFALVQAICSVVSVI